MALPRANGLPKFTSSPTLSKRDLETARINNQFVLNGNTPSFPTSVAPVLNKTIVVFIEYYFATSVGNISDCEGTAIMSSIPANTPLDYGFAPIRVDGGVRFSANGVIAKGFFIEVGYEMDKGVS